MENENGGEMFVLIFIAGIFSLAMFLGVVIGKCFPYVNSYISDRKTVCEEKGGKYNYYWRASSSSYIERCDNLIKEIVL